MDELVVLLIGLVVGFFMGIVVMKVFISPESNNYEQNYATLESVYEQYITELDEKHSAILADIKQSQVQFAVTNKNTMGKQPVIQMNKELSAKSQAVCELLDQGNDINGIAKQLGLGKGEVELILHLKNLGS